MSVTAEGRPNLAISTLGGQQFWTDRAMRAGWRIQCHALSGHCRLLDPADIRRGWGDFVEVERLLETVSPTSDARRRLVVLVHGFGGHAWTFSRLKKALKDDGHEVVHFTYASTLARVPEHAGDLRSYLGNLENVDEVIFIAHSMGGLVVDHALAAETPAFDTAKVSGIVRLGTPVRGSALARQAVDIAGAATPRWSPVADVAAGLAISDASPPTCSIAGSLKGGTGINPWIEGDDDGVVGVSEVSGDDGIGTLVVPASHFTLTGNAETIAAVRMFLKSGRCQPVGS
ncbi:MAG: alpha/beta fold hydrolase [Parvibaculum sp.]|nr:alpha/beta fold hydrolase [Parvibaculum sp.]